jgi:hypothetical protein
MSMRWGLLLDRFRPALESVQGLIFQGALQEVGYRCSEPSLQLGAQR